VPTQNGHETEGTSFPDQLAVTEEDRRLSFGRTAAKRGQSVTPAGAGRHGMRSEIRALADRQWHDYRTRQPGTCFADPGFVLDLSDAYELQDAVATLRVSAGDSLIGYKAGCTGAGTVQQFGMEGPIRGCLFESEVRQHRCAVTGNKFANLAIEGEMAVRIGADGNNRRGFPGDRVAPFRLQGHAENAA
jgi:hypothetical protein